MSHREFRPLARTARVVLAGVAVWAAAITLFGLRLVRSMQAAPSTAALALIAAAGLLAVAAVVAIRLPPVVRIRVATAIVAAGLTVYVCEAVLALDLAPRAPPTTQPPKGVKSIAQHTADLRAGGVDAYPYLVPMFLLAPDANGLLRSRIALDGHETLPLAGVAMRPTIYCVDGARPRLYTSDEHGFHNPPGLWRTGLVDIAFIGDSFTNGVCVPSGQGFADRVREIHPATLNLGIAADGPLAELATLEEYLPHVQPRRVVWMFYEGNDLLGDIEVERRSPLLLAYLAGDGQQGLVARRDDLQRHLIALVDDGILSQAALAGEANPGHSLAPAPNLVRVRPPTAARFVAIAFLRNLRHRLGLTYGRPTVDIKLFSRVLARANATTRSWGGELLFVYLPSSERYLAAAGSAPLDDQRRHVLAVARGQGIATLDLAEALQRTGDVAAHYPPQGGHFNERGHAFVAREVLAALGASGMRSARSPTDDQPGGE